MLSALKVIYLKVIYERKGEMIYMSHPIPKDLKGEERIISIPYIDLHFNKKATLYCGVVTVISGLTLTINFYLFLVLFIVLNFIAYPLASFTTKKTKFEGGNVPLDVYYLRKFKYKYKQNVYVRGKGK